MQKKLVQETQDNEALYGEEISFGTILQTLFMHKGLIFTFTLIISILTATFIFQLTPLYKSSTQLLFGKDSKVVDIQAVIANDLVGDSAILGEMELIKSRSLIKRVIDSLNLNEQAEFNPELRKPGPFSAFNPKELLKELLTDEIKELIGLPLVSEKKSADQEKSELYSKVTDNFLSKLKLSQIKRSQVVVIEMESESPKLAAQMANELAKQYIAVQLEAKYKATINATGFLNKKLEELKEKVVQSERAIEKYRQENGITQVQGNIGLSEQQLSQINSQLIITRAQRAEASARVNQVQRLLRHGGDVSSVSEVLNSALIQRLKVQESTLQQKYSEMSVEFGKKHPKMIQIQAELKDINFKIKSEVQKISSSLKNELDIVNTRVGSLTSSLKQVQQQTGGDRESQVGLRALEREALANRTLFETFLTRYKETTSTQGMEEANARVISKAEVPFVPFFPNKKLFLLIGVLGGLFFSMVLAFVLEMMKSGIKSPEQVEKHIGLPTLGIIPLTTIKQQTHDYVLERPHSSLTEAINSLRVSLMLLNTDEQVKSLLVTSAAPSEGKSTLALLVARISAQAGQKVVLIDTDFRRPSIAPKLGIEKNHTGLTDLLNIHDLSVEDALYTDDKTGMKILLQGASSYNNPVDMFASPRMGQIVDELKNNYELVILDSPPVMAVTDSKILSHLVDKTLLVLRWNSTPRKVFKASVDQLAQSGADNVAGIVLQQVDLNKYSRAGQGDSGYFQYYSKYSQYYVN